MQSGDDRKLGYAILAVFVGVLGCAGQSLLAKSDAPYVPKTLPPVVADVPYVVPPLPDPLKSATGTVVQPPAGSDDPDLSAYQSPSPSESYGGNYRSSPRSRRAEDGEARTQHVSGYTNSHGHYVESYNRRPAHRR